MVTIDETTETLLDTNKVLDSKFGKQVEAYSNTTFSERIEGTLLKSTEPSMKTGFQWVVAVDYADGQTRHIPVIPETVSPLPEKTAGSQKSTEFSPEEMEIVKQLAGFVPRWAMEQFANYVVATLNDREKSMAFLDKLGMIKHVDTYA